MKRIPNLLSASRIALCLPLLLVDAMTVPFWTLYLIAGLTDILDGFLARRWDVESKFGARLDSLADFVFVLAVGYNCLHRSLRRYTRRAQVDNGCHFALHY